MCLSSKGMRYPVELKAKGAMPREESVVQVPGYKDTCGSSVRWPVVFDSDFAKNVGKENILGDSGSRRQGRARSAADWRAVLDGDSLRLDAIVRVSLNTGLFLKLCASLDTGLF
jgi:hypothetical protein